MESKSSFLCNVLIGEVVIGLECPTPEYAAELREYFGDKDTFANQTINLKLEINSCNNNSILPNSLFTYKNIHAGGFEIGDGLVRGWYNRDKKIGKLHINKILTKGAPIRIFEQLLYQAFYSARNFVKNMPS